LTVVGIALSPIAAESLQAASGIKSQTLALQEQAWEEGRNPATPNHVVVVDGAEMIGLKQLERVVAVADKARGKLVLVGHPQQLEAMGSSSPLQNVLNRIGLIAAARAP